MPTDFNNIWHRPTVYRDTHNTPAINFSTYLNTAATLPWQNMNLVLITLTTNVTYYCCTHKYTQFSHERIVHQALTIRASIRIVSFFSFTHTGLNPIQSIALLTMLYDKSFQVSIKHCVESAMLDLASDTLDGMIPLILFIRYLTTLRSELTGSHKPRPLDRWTQEFQIAVTQLTHARGELAHCLAVRCQCHGNGTGGWLHLLYQHIMIIYATAKNLSLVEFYPQVWKSI